MHIVIHTDGGARGNPGPAAIGVVIEEFENQTHDAKGNIISEFGKKIGETTNNVAEYTAVIEALLYLKTHLAKRNTSPPITVSFFLDSTLVVNQLNGLFKIKEPHLRDLMLRVRFAEQSIAGVITYTAVPREQNKRADLQVNQTLDG